MNRRHRTTYSLAGARTHGKNGKSSVVQRHDPVENACGRGDLVCVAVEGKVVREVGRLEGGDAKSVGRKRKSDDNKGHEEGAQAKEAAKARGAAARDAVGADGDGGQGDEDADLGEEVKKLPEEVGMLGGPEEGCDRSANAVGILDDVQNDGAGREGGDDAPR